MKRIPLMLNRQYMSPIKYWNINKTNIFKYFQKLFIIFWVFSLLGHYGEIIWAQINHIITSQPVWQPINSTIIPIAPPYGLGAIIIVLLIWPLIKQNRINYIGVFILSVLITGFIEYISAAAIVAVNGQNNFWDYSQRPYNINGYVCLENILLFASASTIFIYYIYPVFEKALRGFKEKNNHILFWVLLISYVADLTYSNLLK